MKKYRLMLMATVIFFIGAGCTPFMKSSVPVTNDNSMMKNGASMEEKKMVSDGNEMRGDSMMQKGVMKNDDDIIMEKDIMMKEEEGVMGDDVVMQKGLYEAYAAGKVALAQSGTVILFFHAPWCPSCRSVNTDIENNLMKIPSRTVILKTDYDSNSALRKKYGVTFQHTFVQVDKDGNSIKKWSGSSTLEEILAQVQ